MINQSWGNLANNSILFWKGSRWTLLELTITPSWENLSSHYHHHKHQQSQITETFQRHKKLRFTLVLKNKPIFLATKWGNRSLICRWVARAIQFNCSVLTIFDALSCWRKNVLGSTSNWNHDGANYILVQPNKRSKIWAKIRYWT